jgi:signal transduction histidine kinase
MINESITEVLLAALNVVVLEPLNGNNFRILGHFPKWFHKFYPDVEINRNSFQFGKKFLFIENFLIDAEKVWNENAVEPLKSGIWSETDLSGNESYLEATAIRLNNRNILLIELPKIAYEEKQFIIQQGRESRLTYDHLVKEIQKKEILLHCIVHDLGGQVSAINNCLELLSLENLTVKGRNYLQIGKSQSMQQGMLIQEILNAFSADVDSLESLEIVLEQAPEIGICVKETVEALLPSFSLKKVSLQLGANTGSFEKVKVVGEKVRLERVLFNLVENAFRHSPPNSTVTVDIQDDDEFILLTVEDEGGGVQPELANKLFQKFVQGKEKSGRAGLGLYFCRITVESWGGTIGYSPRSEGGSRFWVRLPKLTSLL